MSNPYLAHVSRVVPQSEKAEVNQTKNNASGYVFKVSDKTRLERFLILGTTGGTYYQNEQEITRQNIDDIRQIVIANPMLVIEVIRSVVSERRALRQSPTIFLTALLFQHGKNFKTYIDPSLGYGWSNQVIYGELRTLVSEVCQTSTQLYELCSYFKVMGGWSRARREAVKAWYENKPTKDVAYQMVKYRQRYGWAHRDVLRLSHASVDPMLEKFAERWYKPEQNAGVIVDDSEELNIVRAFLVAQKSTVAREALQLLGEDYAKNLPWEAFPTQIHKELDFWKTLFYNGSLRNQALIRNITRLARLKAFTDLNFARDYADKLLKEATGLHPLNFLNAYVVYTDGQVQRNPKKPNYMHRVRDWTPEAIIRDALQQGFYDSFAQVVPSGKRIFLGLDISGSMSALASGLDISCAQLCAVMAMAIARTERNYIIRGFDTTLLDLGISATTDLQTTFRVVSNRNYGGTNCSLPMVWAEKNKVEIDTFVVLTDNETRVGNIHPHKALESYRQKMGIGAGQIVVAATATPFTIADPNDSKTLDVVGADANLPKLISDFC